MTKSVIKRHKKFSLLLLVSFLVQDTNPNISLHRKY